MDLSEWELLEGGGIIRGKTFEFAAILEGFGATGVYPGLRVYS